MGRNAPNPIAIPPILGMGALWIFLSSGMSRIFVLCARLIEIGISKMVMMVDMRNVENIIIVKFQFWTGLTGFSGYMK